MAKIIVKLSRISIIMMLLASVITQPAAATPAVEVGIATGGSLLNMPPSILRQRLLEIKQLGASWIRVDFSWTVIQPHNYYDYDFRFHDKVVKEAERAGIKIMGLLTYTPAWARTNECVSLAGPRESELQKCAPRDDHEFANFALKTAWRYRLHNIHAWEIWNEPNLVGYWKEVNKKGEFFINPERYGKLATRTGNAIHGVDPHVTVVTGGMSPMYEPSPTRGMRQSDYLRGMLPYLSKGGVNAVGIHPYTWPATPRTIADWNAFYTVDKGDPQHNLHDILGQADRGDLQLWATEYGASTSGRTRAGSRTTPRVRPDHVDEQTQAQIIKEAVEDWHTKPNVGPIFIYSDRDQYLPQHKNEGGFGLRRRDGSLKPAHNALKEALTTARSSIYRGQ